MFRKPLLAFSGLILWITAGTAAAEDANINSMSYETQAVFGFDVINVYSSDGQQWDTFSGPPLKFSAIMDVDTRWPGYIKDMGVLNGRCVDGGCAHNPAIHVGAVLERDLHWSRVLEIAMDDIPTTTSEGFATIPLGDEILQVCNDHLSAAGATSLYTFNRMVPTSFSVDTGKAAFQDNFLSEVPESNGFVYGDESRQASFRVQVRCNPYEEDFDVDDDAVTVEDIQLFLATFSNAVTRPDAFRTCKQGRILVRATTDQEGPVALRLWTDTAGVIESEYILTWSASIGSGVYQAEVERWVSVSETSLLQAMAEVINPGSVGPATSWKQLSLECVAGTDQLTGDAPTDVPAKGDNGGLVSN